jgi:cell division protein FtsZ
MFEITNTESEELAIIKVVGVGGGGCNAVNHMIQNAMKGVEFICMNTDAQALKGSLAPTVLQLGSNVTRGLGAGADPDIGKESALEDRDRIAEMVQGADMLFITAGMGGGTGTGAAPIVAQIAKEMGILTVAVVSKPFTYEGKRLKVAQAGMDALAQHVDSLIVIPNEKLMDVLGKEIAMLDAFKAANDVLHGAVAGIAEVINCTGLVNVDFADVKTVMSEMGMAMMGSAIASGVDRARMAAEEAVASPLLEEITLTGARGVLVNITASSAIKMREVQEVMDTVKKMTAEDATIIVGSVIDEGMDDSLRVTLVATGLCSVSPQVQRPMTVIHSRTGTDDRGSSQHIDEPAVMRTGRRSNAAVTAMQQSGMDPMDIPAFLRRQAD